MSTGRTTKAYDSAGPMVVPEEGDPIVHFGLTKREYFAVMALAGFCGDLLNAPASSTSDPATVPERAALLAVRLADELIAELNK